MGKKGDYIEIMDDGKWKMEDILMAFPLSCRPLQFGAIWDISFK